jgi:hypothetical protein
VIYEKYPEGSLGMENVHNEISDWIEEQFTKAFPGKKIDVSTTQVTIEENGQEVTIPLKCYESIFAVTMSDAQNLGFFTLVNLLALNWDQLYVLRFHRHHALFHG